jgi:hypothetical protein
VRTAPSPWIEIEKNDFALDAKSSTFVPLSLAAPAGAAAGVYQTNLIVTSVVTRVHRDWTKLPLWITENGTALHDYVGPDGRCHDPERIEYFAGHFRAVARAIEQGGFDHGTQTRLLESSASCFAGMVSAKAMTLTAPRAEAGDAVDA